MKVSAKLSADRRFRYDLWRPTGNSGHEFALFIGLNPSTADETQDDPTVRRCVGYARAWGYAGLCLVNLFAFRATEPEVLKAQPDPVGPENDGYLLRHARRAGVVVAAWGVHGAHRGRDRHVRSLIPCLHYLKLTKDGHPAHPLYLKGSLTPQPWGDQRLSMF